MRLAHCVTSSFSSLLLVQVEYTSTPPGLSRLRHQTVALLARMGMLIPDSTGQQGALHHREGLQFFHPHFVIELGPLAEPATGRVHQDPVKPAGREGRCALFSCRDKLLVDRYWTGWVYSPGGTPSPATAFLPSATKAVTLSRPSLAQVCRMEAT